MAVALQICGEPSTGKSFGTKFLDPKTTFIIDGDMKGLPYKGWTKDFNAEAKNYLATNDLGTIFKVLKGISDNAPHIKVVTIDTITGILTDKMMAESKKPGFNKWMDLAADAYELYEFIRAQLRPDLIVCIMAHVAMLSIEKPDGTKVTRYTTKYPGNMLTKLSMNSKLNYILYTTVEATEDGFKYGFITQNDGTTEARSSYGVLPLRMENNLETVRQLITEAEFN